MATPTSRAVEKGLDLIFDPRYDLRKKEQEKLRKLTTQVEERGTQEAPRIPLVSLEGQPFVSTMSDRTRAGGILHRINDVDLAYPVNLQGGQGYMLENEGQVWASAPSVVDQIMQAAKETRIWGKQDPLYIPWRMAPTGGDFAKMTGETMLSYAASNMTKKDKKALDRAMKEFVPDWRGIDSPESIEQFRALSAKRRKAVQNMLDRDFRDKGGLSLGEARLAVSDPTQINAQEGGVQNVGRIFTGRPPVIDSGHPSYPAGVSGEGIGTLNRDIKIFDLMPDVVEARNIGDLPTQQDIRSLQMKPYKGTITEQVLRNLEDKGIDINSPAYTGLLAALIAGGGIASSVAPQRAEAGTMTSRLAELIAQGYPESVAKRIASGELPMDQASRMQRASEQGYDLTPYYSGYDAIRGVKDDRLGNQPITEVTESLWASDNPLIAGTYSASLGGGNIHPLLMRSPEAVLDAKGNQWQNLLGIDVTPESYSSQLSTNKFARSAEESGANVAEIQNVVDYGNKAGKMKKLYPDFEDLTKAGSNVRIDLSGNNTRSLLSAAFDPEYTGPNILGSRVIPTTAAGLLAAGAMAPEDAEAATGYKLFRQVDGKLYPLFVNRNTEVPMGEWLKAEAGELTPEGKVKSSLGPLAYRPGWHAGDLPIATHIGGKSGPVKAPNYRPNDQVWAEVEFPEDVDWQAIANANATRNKAGEIIPRTAQITDQVPYGGFYRYKTNPNMTGEWMIGGDMKVNRVLSDEEVQAINEAAGVADLPRLQSIKDKTMLATPIAGAGLMAALAPERAQAQELDPNLPLTVGQPREELSYDYGGGATIPLRPEEQGFNFAEWNANRPVEAPPMDATIAPLENETMFEAENALGDLLGGGYWGYEAARNLINVADFMPWIGSGISLQQGADAYRQGKVGEGRLLTGLGLLEFIPVAGKMASETLQGMKAARQARRFDNAFANQMNQAAMNSMPRRADEDIMGLLGWQ